MTQASITYYVHVYYMYAMMDTYIIYIHGDGYILIFNLSSGNIIIMGVCCVVCCKILVSLLAGVPCV